MSNNNTSGLNATPTAIAIEHLGNGAINAQSKQNILNLVEKLPAINQGYFECHFTNDGRVDFAFPVSIQQKETIATILNMHRESNANGTPQGEANGDNIENLWFEFDTSAADFNGLPGVFFDLHLLHTLNLNTANAEASFWANSLSNTIPVFGSRNFSPENVAAMQQCIAQLGTNGYPAYVGIMKNRKDDLRLCVKLLNTTQLLPYLNSIGLGVSPGVAEKLTYLAANSDLVAVDMDFEDGKILPNFGIELHISKANDQHLHEQELLARLMQQGLCNATQAENILHWPAREKDEFIHRISHFKLKMQQTNITAAKAYLHYIYKA